MENNTVLTTPVGDVMLGALAGVLLRGMTRSTMGKLGVANADTKDFGSAAIVTGVGFLTREKLPPMSHGAIGAGAAMLAQSALTRFNLPDDFGISQMGAGTTPPAAGLLGGSNAYARRPAAGVGMYR